MHTIEELSELCSKKSLCLSESCSDNKKYIPNLLEGLSQEWIDLLYKAISDHDIKIINYDNATGKYVPSAGVVTLYVDDTNYAKVLLFHELAHALDDLLLDADIRKSATDKHIVFCSSALTLSNEKTLEETIKREVKRTGDEAYRKLYGLFEQEMLKVYSVEELNDFNEFQKIEEEIKPLNRKFKSDIFGLIRAGKLSEASPEKMEEKHRELHDLNERKRELEGNRMLQTYFQTPEYKSFESGYSIVIDILGASVKIDRGIFTGHSNSYLKRKGNLGTEFFAECAADILTKNEASINNTKSFFPESYSMFLELLEIIKGRIKGSNGSDSKKNA